MTAEDVVRACRISVEAVTDGQVKWAMIARQQFGRDRHAAGLNFGDCFAHALAKETCEPLLFNGGDFALTDIPAAA